MTDTGGRPARPAPALSHVVRTERLTPGLVRVVLGGETLAPFVPNPHADSYVKLMFLPPGPRPLTADGRLDADTVKAALPDGVVPRLRAYTVRAFDAAALELTLDVVVHGDEGLAGPWAASARPGDEALVLGPGGGWSPDPAVDHHLLIGDVSALPAIAVGLERLGRDTRGDAVIEVQHAHDELALDAPSGIRVHWVHTDDDVPGARLVAAARALPWPDGTVGVFLHGEAGAVRDLRSYLRVDRAVPRERMSVSGYWRLGVDDEGWRRAKAQWSTSIEEAEAAAGLG
ncbi:siderophore-interacting protein [Cellulomonas composti]|uniref:Siderophore-interacting protein n=1 Tax=Cellulomonas composti TaxID=266130 RepID=A0A511JAB8_9CELL|nr:siderophore-interacting protein [Cellulomonas composti]GEL94935.1 siderophore-interacting protein [Cellulomonas composti]